MAILSEIRYASLDELYLDPLNPRLGRLNTNANLSQSRILELIKGWTLEELGVSFLESGFWPQEALIVVSEKIYGKTSLVVIEGNRRLAALKFLKKAVDKDKVDRVWRDMISDNPVSGILFTHIPYIRVEARKDVESFLGFRHVTGIKEWNPAEKAQYIAKLIEESNLSYFEVMRRIGSKTPTVRQTYIAYRLLLQMEDQGDIDIEEVEERFSVLFLSLRTEGVKAYLSINMQAEPKEARNPVSKTHSKQLSNFALWLFGNKIRNPVVRDSRQIDQFGRILLSKKALDYLERNKQPSFETALQLAGGDEPEVVRLIESAADDIEAALSRAHRYTKSRKLKIATERLGQDFLQLLSLFPDLQKEIFSGASS